MKARIGKQIPHYETVDRNSVKGVFSGDRVYRYCLSVKYIDTLLDSGRGKELVVIMKNPSAADHAMADATIRKVETFVYNRFTDVRWLHILNIFAYRATDPQDLNAAYSEKGALYVIGKENDYVITETIRAADYILLGWGNNSGIDLRLYEERIYRVKQILQLVPAGKLFVVRGQNQTKQPLHGLMWGYNFSIIPAGKITS